jgi:hypothetical protein
MTIKITYGIIATNLISGSRIPRFLFVNLAAIASLKGPAVKSPIKAPIKIAKLKNPILVDVKLYGGAAKACDCVRFRVKKDEAVHETTKEENSTMGKRKSFHGSHSSMKKLPSYG